MSYYTALISAWNTGTVPSNYTGTALTGLTTANKLVAINGWTTTGVAPVAFQITGSQIASCINYAEFKALTAQQQSNVLGLCQIGSLTGGSAETALLVDGMFIDYFGPSSQTIIALTALAQGTVTYWWQNNGYTGPFSQADLTAAGGLT